jgi:hypothetical protein
MARSAGRPELNLGVVINRDVKHEECSFKDVFGGFEKVKAVRSIFRDKTEKVLTELRVELTGARGYLHINDEVGSIVVNPKYLVSGREEYLYLDVIHELVHIRQFMEGRELFDRSYTYLERPTEVEAYQVTVREAKRIGMSADEIVEYLRVEWVTEQEFQRFLVSLGLATEEKTEAS